MNAVPVFMYHGVGIPMSEWKWNHLTIHYKLFEEQLIFLSKNKYKTIHLEELYASIKSGIPLSPKTVILTFDDGYADNYIFAYPLLKKYGLKGTIFVNPDFVDPRNLRRKRLDQTSDPLELETKGFLTWEEMLEMEADGTIDIQSHALTHTWYPISDEIIDFRHPGDDYGWMTWNDHPKRKPFLHLDDPELIKYGVPVYKNEKSLMCRRFFPEEGLNVRLQEFVMQNGGINFYEQSEWKKILLKATKQYKASNIISGEYESNEERFKRIRWELSESKRILDEKLGKCVEFLCWPGGSGTKDGHIIAKEVGYKMTTSARDIEATERRKIKNDGQFMSDRIGRTSPILYQKVNNKKVKAVYGDGFGIWLRINSFKSTGLYQKILNASLILYGRVFRGN